MSEPKSRRIPHPIWFAVAAVLMVVLWVVVYVWLPYHREQVVIREIERLGGEVLTHRYGPEQIKADPEWLQEIVDDGWLSWFDRVWYVVLNETSISDEGLRHLTVLKNLAWLYLYDTQISDEGMKHISGLSNLEILYLGNTRVSDEGLKHLSGLTNLEMLYLRKTQVTDEGVKELQKALPYCEINH